MTTDDCPGCTACIDAELLTEADRERPVCGPMTPCIQESERDALARRITNLRAELRVCWDDLATHPADPAQLTARIDDLCGAARRLRGALVTIDENPRPLVIDAPWIGWSPTNEAERAARDAWSRTTLIMQWRFTVELGPGTVIEPRTQPDGSICAGPWPVGAETITREPQTVYCATGMQRHLSHPDASMGLPGLSYAYEDRLQQNDADKWRHAIVLADASGEPRNSAYWLSALLTSYNGKPCVVEHVIAGVNHMNGHSWWAAGRREAACHAL